MYLPKTSDWEAVQRKFQQVWGYPDFRFPQGEIVRCLLDKQDALVVMPTGGGKSICFQLPALLNDGLTIVVSPLVALMENQVQELRDRHLPVALLHSELSDLHRQHVLRELEQRTLRLLYLSPETLFTDAVWNRLCAPDLVINGLILDEAHCLVQWGDSFRPAYRRLGAVRAALLQHKPEGAEMAIAAFTATADPAAQQTLQQVLQLQQPQEFLQSPYRANLNLAVQVAWTPRQRRQKLLKFIQSHPQKSGLVYVRTRKDAEELADWLRSQSLQTAAYHAGLAGRDRRQLEADWLNNRLQFVVCTSAFGMGINKANVRWVAHFHAPTLLSEYIQEVGRAGRDGWTAEALTLISEPTGWLDPEDKQRRQFFQSKAQKQRQVAQRLASQLPQRGTVQAVTRAHQEGAIALAHLHATGQLTWDTPFEYRLHPTATSNPAIQRSISEQANADRAMTWYLNTPDCRWRFLLSSFGFEKDAEALGRGCGHCDRCLSRGIAQPPKSKSGGLKQPLTDLGRQNITQFA
jgi:ATP-dependent DNA helicase RecQ